MKFSMLSPVYHQPRADWELPQDNDYVFYVSLNIWSPYTLYMHWNITWSSLELRAYNLWNQHTSIQRKGGCSCWDRKPNLEGTNTSPCGFRDAFCLGLLPATELESLFHANGSRTENGLWGGRQGAHKIEKILCLTYPEQYRFEPVVLVTYLFNIFLNFSFLMPFSN